MEALRESVIRLTALGAISGAADILLKENTLREGIRMWTGILAVLEVANLALRYIPR